MKKLYYIFSFILIFCFAKASFGFVDQRYQYWQLQLNSLQKERNKLLQSKTSDRSIVNLINNDVKRVESILKFFQRSLDTDLSGFKKKKYTQIELNNEIEKILTPLFSLNYLEFILNKTGSRNSYKLAEKYTKELIDSAIYKYFNQSCSIVRETLLNEKFTKNDWKYLAAEVLLGAMILNRETIFDEINKKVKNNVLKVLIKTDLEISPKNLKSLIETVSKEIIVSTDFESLINHSENPLTASWSWNDKYTVIAKELNNLKNIELLFHKVNIEPDLQHIFSIRKNIPEIQDLYFSNLQNKYYSELKLLKDKKYKNSENFTAFDNPYFLNIPDMPELSAILSDIDKVRKAYINNQDSNINTDSISILKNKLSNLIITSISKTQSDFIDEENLLNDLNEQYMDISGNIHENENIKNHSENQINESPVLKLTPVNKAEFDRAKELFIRQTEMAYEYAESNLKFIELGSELKKSNSKPFFRNINKRFKRNTQYIKILENLSLNCSGLETLTNPGFHKRYHSTCVRISNLLNFIGYSFSFKRDKLKHLDIEQLNEIRMQNGTIKNEIANCRKNINSVYIAMIKSLEIKRNKLKVVKNEMKDELVNIELDYLSDSLVKYINVYERLNYSAKALKNYAEKYSELLERAESGTKNKNLDLAIQSGSIIPLVRGFSPGKIEHEYALKNYVKNIISKRLSSMQTLITYYRRKKINTYKIPDNLIESVKTKLRIRTDIPVANWSMNESNFGNIDKKAVRKLHFIMKRRIWRSAKNNNDSLDNTININDFKISLSIPDGWIEQKVNSVESNNGIIKAFKSIDGNSTIYIAGYDFSKNVKDASEYWINEMNSRKVAQEWGERNASDYFWTLSDHKNGVMESYAISCKKKILILSGIVSRDKYNFFKKKMTSLFQSVSSI